MANRLYDNARNLFARGDLHWKVGGDTFRLFLVDSALYTPNTATHTSLSDIPVGARVGDNGNTAYNNGAQLTVSDPTDGICDAADTTMLLVPAGGPYEYIVIYKEGTADADSYLVVFVDTALNLPVTTAGLNVLVSWDNGANKIFKL